jgi:hypothetical protein
MGLGLLVCMCYVCVEFEAFIEFSEALWRKRNNMCFVLNGICGWNFTSV